MAGARGSARRPLVGRLFRPRNRRRGTWRGLGRRAWRLVRIATPVLLLGASWPLVRDGVRRHPYFAVHEVVLHHHGQLAPAHIRAAAGIEPGTSIWDIDVERARFDLERQPWIRRAEVRRHLPDRVVILVREHRPKAIVALADDAEGRYYVAANSRIFAALGAGDTQDLPWITGLVRADLGGGDAFGPRAVRRALAVLRLADGVEGLGAVSEIHVARERGLTLLPTRPAMAVELGWDGFATKLGRVAKVLPLWAGRESEIAAMSCLFEDEVVVRLRGRRAVES